MTRRTHKALALVTVPEAWGLDCARPAPLVFKTSPDDTREGLAKPGRKRLHHTASARQRAYRRRVLEGQSGIATTTDDPGQGATRLDLYLSATAALKLDRLSRHGGTSRAQVLGVLLEQAEAHALKNMTEDAQDDYFTG